MQDNQKDSQVEILEQLKTFQAEFPEKLPENFLEMFRDVSQRDVVFYLLGKFAENSKEYCSFKEWRSSL